MNTPSQPCKEVDLLIVGAGISGLGMGAYMRMNCPEKNFVIVEARDGIGGTWDLFKYPGIRSDSDLHTFGYEFKPWKDKNAIASADRIMNYLHETADEYDLKRNIAFGQKVKAANWCSARSRWLINVADVKTGHTETYAAKWFFSAAGYYNYDQGFTPDFPGIKNFTGQVVHPQQWPENLDYKNKKVVVIGSGATAFTLIPSMAKETAHITMLQRTPTYVVSLPSEDKIANKIKQYLPEKLAHSVVRRKVITQQRLFWLYCQKFPNHSRKYLRKLTERQLPAGVDVDVHFNPPYNPWDQRLCVVPSGDFFKALRAGKASIATDHIAGFEGKEIILKSGQRLEADILITATGLNIQLMGGMEITIDEQPVKINEKVIFKGMMVDGVPNFSFSVGYTNSSWTLKVGLLCEHVTRLFKHMDKKGCNVCTPQRPTGEFETRPMLDFGAGYVQRALSMMPRQGTDKPWSMSMNYFDDERMLRKGPVTDKHLRFEYKAPQPVGHPDQTTSGSTVKPKRKQAQKEAA